MAAEVPGIPAYRAAAVLWRKGGLPDDTLNAALLVSRVFAYVEDGRGTAAAAQEWLQGFGMRVTGEPHYIVVSPPASAGTARSRDVPVRRCGR
ncbi:hypothetical protein [Streptomyces sp. NBC_00239]|uniref:hypothetical protein n=1 Tax=Streptomyces sp. NBC_00239 TaxID=2903640 RepID=UPI002E2BCE4D|nr:hypothetical protein [Streptomyces sp. NBC_00239]